MIEITANTIAALQKQLFIASVKFLQDTDSVRHCGQVLSDKEYDYLCDTSPLVGSHVIVEARDELSLHLCQVTRVRPVRVSEIETKPFSYKWVIHCTGLELKREQQALHDRLQASMESIREAQEKAYVSSLREALAKAGVSLRKMIAEVSE